MQTWHGGPHREFRIPRQRPPGHVIFRVKKGGEKAAAYIAKWLSDQDTHQSAPLYEADRECVVPSIESLLRGREAVLKILR